MAVLDGELINGLGLPDGCVSQPQGVLTDGLGIPGGCLSQPPPGVLTDGLGIPDSCLSQSLATLTNGLTLPSGAFSIISYQSLFKERNYVNYQSSFTRFFGQNFQQDTEKIIISKADLLGLTSLTDNTAESIFICLLIRNLTYEANFLLSTAYVETWKIEFIKRNNQSYINHILLIHLLFISYQYDDRLSVVDYDLVQLPSYF